MKPVRFVLAAALAVALSVVITPPAAQAAGSVSAYQQCRNVTVPAPYTSCDSWVNGGLNSQNHYAEDNVLPQRVVFTATNTAANTITVAYDDLKSGTLHGYDYLATWNATQGAADGCQGLAGAQATVCAGPSSFAQMASDGATRAGGVVSTHELPAAQRQWTIRGGTITNVSPITHDSTHGLASITFTANAAGPVIILFGGHLAVGTPSSAPRSWGNGVGAHDLPGGSLGMDIGGANNTINAGAIAALPPAAFSITKTASTSTSSTGGSVTYTVTVKNTGGQAGTTSFTDAASNGVTPAFAGPTVPSGGSCTAALVCTTGSLNPGASQVFTFTATMPTSFTGAQTCTGGYNVTNTATITGVTPATATVCVSAASTFSITKTASSATSTTGGSVTYTVTVKNTGTAPGSTGFTDTASNGVTPAFTGPTAPSGGTCTPTLTCTTSTLNPGDSQTFTFAATMPSSFTGDPSPSCANGGYRVTNTATLTGGGNDTAPVCVAAASGFSITKTASSATSTTSGAITYTVTVKNTGTAPGSTSFTDTASHGVTPTFTSPTAPSGGSCTAALTCTTSTLNPGDSQVFTFAATMPSSFTGAQTCADGYSVTNTATLTGGGDDTATVCVAASPSYSITKTAGSTTADAGDRVEYTVVVTNTGTAPGATSFTDDYDDDAAPVLPLPEGCADSTSGADLQFTCDTHGLDPGERQTFTYELTMPTSFSGAPGLGCELVAIGSYPVTNQVTLGTSGPSDPATVCVSATPDFAVTKTPSSETAGAGDTVTYTVVVTNNGSGPGSTSFTDDYDDAATPTLPDSCFDTSTSNPDNLQFTCTTGVLDPGESQTFTYDVTMSTSFSGPPSEVCDNGGFAVANLVTLSNGDDTAGATVCVTATPEFTVEKTAGSATAHPGDPVSYTVVVTNNGSGPGSTSFTDDYDDDVTAVLPLADGCVDASTATNDAFTCTTGSIDPGETQTFTYSMTMPGTFAGDPTGCEDGGYAVVNTVTVSTGGSTDPATVCVDAAPDFSIDKTVTPDDPGPGDGVTYTVTVTNNGSARGSTTVTDEYDARLDSSLSIPEGCTKTTVLECETGTIEPGESESFVYTATIPTAFTGPSDCTVNEAPGYLIGNRASIPGDSAAIEICVPAAPDFTITKSVDPTIADPGDTVHYTVVVHNDGDAEGSTGFVDNYDDDVQADLPTGNPTGGTCNRVTAGDDLFSCVTGTIPAHSAQTFTYDAVLPGTFDADDPRCEDGGFSVTNVAGLVTGGADAPAQVCVDASPAFTVDKSVSDLHALPNQQVTYTVVVSNDGTAAGSTTFTDNFDDRLDASITAPSGCTKTTTGDLVLDCETAPIPAGESETFTYTAVMPDVLGGSGGTCADGSFPIVNEVSVGVGGAGDSVTICVPAAPRFEVAKGVDDATADPGQTVIYTVTVSNTGHAAGSTTVIDDYDNRLTPTVPNGCGAAGGVLTCTTGTLAPGAHQDFVYSAVLPATYTGPSGGGSCAAGSYPVDNTASVTTGDHGASATRTVCVAAAPDLHLVKSVVDDVTTAGDELLTYTLAYSNTGPAEANDVRITDAIPVGTSFVSCTGGCSTTGNPVTAASWAIAPVAPSTGHGSVVLVVKVTGKEACTVTNTAQIQAGSAAPVSSNTVISSVTPPTDPTGANASGSARGAQVLTAGLLNLLIGGNGSPLGYAQTSQTGPGGPVLDDDALLKAKIPGNGSLVQIGAVTATSASAVAPAPMAARQLSTAEVAHVCLVPVNGICTVETDTLRAVAGTMASGSTISYTSAGSTIQNLRVLGLGRVVDLNQTTRISLPPLVFGPGSYVAINEKTANSGLVGGKLVANLTVTMIHLKITGILGLQSAEIVVGQASAHSEFLKTFVCNPVNDTVSGHAYVAGLDTGPLQLGLLQGYVQISPHGGADEQHLAELTVPANGSVVGAGVADSSAVGSVDGSHATSTSVAEIAGQGTQPLCVLRTGTTCVVTATAIRSEARSTADGVNGSHSIDTGTTLANLKVLGVSIAANVAPNTTISLPGIGFVVLNEQVCDGGGVTTHSCDGYPHSGITVRAVHVVVTVAQNLLGLQPGIQLVVAEAHADASYL